MSIPRPRPTNKKSETAMPVGAPGVADRLHAETTDAHHAAERAAMQHLFQPKVFSKKRYAAYLRGLYRVYGALEEQLQRHREHPLLGRLLRPELMRTAAIAEDCAALGEAAGEPSRENSAAADYAGRIRKLGQDNPISLVAHIYTRYLGDLYGGQIILEHIRRQLQLPDNQGVQSLLFPQISDLAAFRKRFRDDINELPLPPATVNALVEEALFSFALSQALFESLDTAA